MAVAVVDASALAAILFGEPEAGGVVHQLASKALIAPQLLDFELANACLVKSRRAPEKKEVLFAAFRLRQRLAIEKRAVDHDGVLEVPLQTGLTAYDAAYLWLARQFGAELVTLDRKLAKAAAE